MKTGRKGDPTARDDVHHPVHSASRGLTRQGGINIFGYDTFGNVFVQDCLCKYLSRVYFMLPIILPTMIRKININRKVINMVW